MNTPNVILAEKAISGKSTNNVWVVYTSADSTDKMYCTSPYKAMRLMFLLKKRMGLNISDNCLARLSQEIARAKGSASREQSAGSAEAQPVSSKAPQGATVPEVREPRKSPRREEGASQRLKRLLRQPSTSARLERVGLSSVAMARS